MHLKNRSSLVALVAFSSFLFLAPGCGDDEGDDDSGDAGGGGRVAGAPNAGSGGGPRAGSGQGGTTAGTSPTAGRGGSTAGTAGTAGTTGGSTVMAGSGGQGGEPDAGGGGVAGESGGQGGIGGEGGEFTIPIPMRTFTFEPDAQMATAQWRAGGDPFGTLGVSTEQFFLGTQSLELAVLGPDAGGAGGAGGGGAGGGAGAGGAGAGGEDGGPTITEIKTTFEIDGPALLPGQVVTLRIYAESTTGFNYAQLFVQHTNWSLFVPQSVSLVAGQWVTVTWRIPTTVEIPIQRLGLQLATRSDFEGSFYIDQVSW